MNIIKQILCLLCISSFLASQNVAFAAKPGGGGGGGGSGEPPAIQVVQLADDVGEISSMNDLLNNTVELVGHVGDGSRRMPVYWRVTQGATSATFTARALPALNPGAYVIPRDVSNHGIIVGHEINWSPDRSTPLVWASGMAEVAVELPVPDLYEEGIEDEDTHVGGISDDGIIVGIVRQTAVVDSPTHLIFWKVGLVEGILVISDPLTVEKNFDVGTYPSISNMGGHVTFNDGGYDGSVFYSMAYRLQVDWDSGLNELYVVPGSAQPLFASAANAKEINAVGTVVGYWNNGVNGTGGTSSGFAIDLQGNQRSVPTLPSFRMSGVKFTYRVSNVMCINNSDEVLSYQWAQSSSGGGLSRPRYALCVLGGTAIDLNTLSPNWPVASATSINNDGWIGGRTWNANGIDVPTVIIR